MEEIVLNVEGMQCSGCENRIKKAILLIDGVNSVEANHITGKVVVKFENKTDIEKIKTAILDLSFTIKE